MSKTEKIVKNFVYEGLGMPIILSSIKMKKIRGEWLPEIDVEKVADLVIKKLPSKTSKLSGNELRFIRTYLNKSKTSFAELFKLSHTSIAKWEAAGNSCAPISPSQEIVLRLYLEDYLGGVDKEFYKVYKALGESVYLEEEAPLKVAL